ncbi:uncharacterized abhydrolase domain-containing protein DDB_G0269086 [Capsella rubella]|uniref:uncharacterized abhydrolase domain-containing protein DDB_G0269086 n=1 Tax=Capsella rubella TaxID=81985 RepID=UPI000CD55C14|nr:uncharacterized abhydrolase domain-containing protein DDB_G0269086 [Capsella rubella]
MALITGLYYHEYPRDMETLGSTEFVGKHFGVGTTIRYDDVKAKLLSMKKASPDRVKMAVLYFLCSVLIGKKNPGKQAPSVEPFFLRAIDDLDMCKTFPWGRLAFDENMKDIFHCMNHFGGVLSTNQWVFPSFVIPLEVLAFEAIPVLKENFREGVSNAHAHRHCPRMCKMKFKASRIMDEESRYDDVDDPVADGWTKCLIDEEKSIWFEELYNQDLATRETNPGDVNPENVILENVSLEDVNPVAPVNLAQLGARLVQLEEQVKQGFKEIIEKVDGLDNIVKSVETYVIWASGENEYYTNEGVGDTNGGGNGDMNEGDKEQSEMKQAEKDKVEREQAEREQAEREHAEKEQAERAKTEKAERAERAKTEKAETGERAKAEKAERAKTAKTEKAERAKTEKAKRAKAEKAERAKAEKAERNKVEKAERAKAEKDKTERAKAEKDKTDKEQADKAERAKAEKDKADKEQAHKAERAKAGKDKADKEQADKVERAKADKEHVEKEQTEKEKAEKSETEKAKVDEEKAQLGTTNEETEQLGTVEEEKEQLGTIEEEKEQLGTTEEGREEDVEMEHDVF